MIPLYMWTAVSEKYGVREGESSLAASNYCICRKHRGTGGPGTGECGAESRAQDLKVK